MSMESIYDKLSEKIDYTNAHWAAFPVFAIGFSLGHVLGGADLSVPFILMAIVLVLLSKNNVDRRSRKVVQAKLDELLAKCADSLINLRGLEDAKEVEIDAVKERMLHHGAIPGDDVSDIDRIRHSGGG